MVRACLDTGSVIEIKSPAQTRIKIAELLRQGEDIPQELIEGINVEAA